MAWDKHLISPSKKAAPRRLMSSSPLDSSEAKTMSDASSKTHGRNRRGSIFLQPSHAHSKQTSKKQKASKQPASVARDAVSGRALELAPVPEFLELPSSLYSIVLYRQGEGARPEARKSESPRKVFILRHASMPCPQLMAMLALSFDTSVVLVLLALSRHYRHTRCTPRNAQSLSSSCAQLCVRVHARTSGTRVAVTPTSTAPPCAPPVRISAPPVGHAAASAVADHASVTTCTARRRRDHVPSSFARAASASHPVALSALRHWRSTSRARPARRRAHRASARSSAPPAAPPSCPGPQSYVPRTPRPAPPFSFARGPCACPTPRGPGLPSPPGRPTPR